MGLSDSVEALLETYSKCIDLLCVFSSSSKGSSSRSTGSPVSSRAAVAYGSVSSDWDRQSQLSHSLRADRAKIQKVYSDRLSETGSRLQKGDGRSRSALRRIVRRLTDALANILGFGSNNGHKDSAMPDGRPLLNYDALRALSNASRIDAIHAIDEVSVRLSSRGSASGRPRSSRASSGRHSASASASSVPSRPKQGQSSNRHRQTPGSSSGSSRERSSSDRRASQASSSQPKTAKDGASSRKHRRSRSSHDQNSSSVSNNNSSGSVSTAAARSRPSPASGHLGRRVSMMSSSTASTKLGEIPERKLRRRQPVAAGNTDPWSGVAPGYNIRPAYPMRPMRLPDIEVQDEKKPKKRFWGMFSG